MGYRLNPITGKLDLVIEAQDAPTHVSEIFANTGTAEPEDGAISLLGDVSQGISSSASASTVIFTVDDATTSSKGVVQLSTGSQTVDGSSDTVAVTPSSLKEKLGPQTQFAVPYGENDSSVIAWTNALTDGQLVIGSTGNPPAAANLTAGAGITITNGSHSIEIAAESSALEIIGDFGTASPNGEGELEIVGTPVNATFVVCSGNSVIVHAYAATTAQKGVMELGTDAEVQEGVLTDVAVVPSALASKLGTQTENGMAYGGGATGVIGWTSALTDGQILVGSTGSAPSATTINSGTNIDVTNGAGSITIATDADVVFDSVTTTNGGSIRSGTTNGDTLLFQAYDTNTGPAYETFATLTTGTSPTFNLEDTVTKAGEYIYRAGGTDVAPADGGLGASSLTGILTGNGASAATASTVTQYAVLLGGASNAVSNVSGVGTASQVLTSQGAGMPPVWAAASGGSGIVAVTTQTFITDSTWTEPANLAYAIVECWGGGAPGGGGSGGSSTSVKVGGGGGSGEYTRSIFDAATLGASQSVTMGSVGGFVSFGGLASAGWGGNGGSANDNIQTVAAGGDGGGNGTYNVCQTNGSAGSPGIVMNALSGGEKIGIGGQGGAGPFGGAGKGASVRTSAQGSQNGGNGGTGAGGGGGVAMGSVSSCSGGNGGGAMVVVTEFISA